MKFPFDVANSGIFGPMQNCKDGKCGKCAGCLMDVEAQSPKAGDGAVDNSTIQTPKVEGEETASQSIFRAPIWPPVAFQKLKEVTLLHQEPTSIPTSPPESQNKQDQSQNQKQKIISPIPQRIPTSLPQSPATGSNSSSSTPRSQLNQESQSAIPQLLPLHTGFQNSLPRGRGPLNQSLSSTNPQPPYISAQNSPPRSAFNQPSAKTIRAGNSHAHSIQTKPSGIYNESQIFQKPRIKLGLSRQDSIALFAKPMMPRDEVIMEEEEEDKVVQDEGSSMAYTDGHRMSIHENGKDGENSIFEIDFEAASVLSNMNIDNQNSGGFLDGNFASGVLRKMETKGGCFVLQFNCDSTLLAVGLNDGKGVELYETAQFRRVCTIEASDTVSALDWIEAPNMGYMKGDDQSVNRKEAKNQLLAVGCFDGSVKVFSICVTRDEMVMLEKELQVQSDVYALSFLKDQTTHYAPNPCSLAVGEKNGELSLFTLSLKGIPRKRVLDTVETAVLSISFGFIKSASGFIDSGSFIMVYGTKRGELRASLLHLDDGEWRVSHVLFELERTGAIRALRFNHDSSLLIVGGYDKTVLIIDTVLWEIVRELYMDGTVQTITYDPFYRYLLIGSRSKVMTVVDTSTLHPIKSFPTDGWVTSISWGGHSTIAMRSDDREVSLMMFEPIQPLELTLKSSRGDDCSVTWSADGRFLARTSGNDVIIADSKKDFETIAKVSDVYEIDDSVSNVISCVRFCQARGKQDRLAMVGRNGYVVIVSIRVSVGKIHQELLASTFVEKNLKSVAWSPDGSYIATGGREMKVHMINSKTLRKRDPIDIGGRIWAIDSLSQDAFINTGDYASNFAIAVSSGRNICTVLAMEANDVSMGITRKRTVRCQKFHPHLPVLAIGDSSNEVMIVDLVGERKLHSFFVDGRVNTITFSPIGDYIGIGTDEGTFTLHDTNNFKCVQEIRTSSIAMSIDFSGTSGQYLSTAHANGDVNIFKLGPLLAIDYVPIERALDLPEQAKREIIYRSPEGPSFLQRCMLDGSKDSLICAGSMLEEAPESVLTFDRTTGMGCFETAVELRKPNIMKLILIPVVDGTLDSRSAWSSSLLTSTMPVDGFLTLRDLILNHPPGFATDILSKMTFMKVPFSAPRRCHVNDNKECGSETFTNPWGKESVRLLQLIRQESLRDGFVTEQKDEVTLIPAVLPLPGLGTLDFLSALLTMSNAGPDVFDNDAMGLVLVVLWNAGIKKYFLMDFMVNIVFYTCWVNFVDRSASSTATLANSEKVVTGLAWAVLLLNTAFLIEQVVRYFIRSGHFFRSSWHIVEVVCIFLVFTYSVQVLLQDWRDDSYIFVTNTGAGNVPLAVITTLLLTIKFVSLLRGFDRTGYLVAILLQNFLDVRGFIIVILCILMGFTVAFRLLLADVPGECKVIIEDGNILSNDCDGDPFGNLPRAVLSTFELTIMGSYESGILYDPKEKVLVSIVFVIAVTVVLVIALNALIAVLGDSFSRVQENVMATRQRERAELIVQYLSIMSTKQRRKIENNNKYFHALLASDGHGDLLRHNNDWQGGLNALRLQLNEISETNNISTQRAIDQLKTELTEDFSAMLQSEVASVLNNVFLELKEMSKFRQASIRTRKAAHAAQAAQTIGGNSTPFDGIRKNPMRDDRSAASFDDSKDGRSREGTLFSM